MARPIFDAKRRHCEMNHHRKELCAQPQLLHSREFRLSSNADRNVGVGTFPDREELRDTAVLSPSSGESRSPDFSFFRSSPFQPVRTRVRFSRHMLRKPLDGAPKATKATAKINAPTMGVRICVSKRMARIRQVPRKNIPAFFRFMEPP
jgi:hypothetical protein